jgi:alkaline phosphatase
MTARAISMAADGKTPVTTVMEMVKVKGLGTGLVTTSGITDATPAAFAAHVPHRSDEASVADEPVRRDVLMGGRKVLPARGLYGSGRTGETCWMKRVRPVTPSSETPRR